MRVPKSYTGSTQLLGMALENRTGGKGLLALPAEAGLPGLFAGTFAHTGYLDYATYLRDQKLLGNTPIPGLDLSFPGSWTKAARDVDLAVIMLPKEKELAEHVFSEIGQGLPHQSRVLVVGPKRGGARSIKPLMEQYFGPVIQTRSARHAVLHEAVKTRAAPRFSGQKTYRETLLNQDVRVVSLPGVFSHGKLDGGTRFLLEALNRVSFSRALDWGCGSGVIGAALKLANPGARVDLVDSNAMALRAACETQTANGLNPEGVYPSDGFSQVNDVFDLIVTNPPFHSGLNTGFITTEQFIGDSGAHLSESGRLIMVGNSFLNYLPRLREHFPIVKILDQNPRYRIFEARKA